MSRTVAIAALAASAMALFLAGCGGGKESETTNEFPPPPTTTTTESTSTTQTTTTETTPATKTIAIKVAGGKVVGGLVHETIDKDAKVTLVVTSDVSDEVHLHGYDKMVDVTPQKPGRLVFVASIPGRFEVELEDRALPIADLEVRP
jgi:hypothetical protein